MLIYQRVMSTLPEGNVHYHILVTTGNHQCAGEVDRLRVPSGPLAAMMQYSSECG